MQEKGNPGVRPRNIYNRRLFLNAAAVVGDGLDAERLYFPQALVSRTAVTPIPPPPLESDELDEDAVPTRIIDVSDIVHPDVPIRGFPEPDDEPPPDAA